MMFRVMGALLALMLFYNTGYSQSHVKDVGGGFFHIFLRQSGTDKTYKIADFDIDNDGDIDCSRITKIGWQNGRNATAPDTVSIHLNSAFSEFGIPSQSYDMIPVLGRKFSDIAKAAQGRAHSNPVGPLTGVASVDSAVFRWEGSSTGSNTYIYVWGDS